MDKSKMCKPLDSCVIRYDKGLLGIKGGMYGLTRTNESGGFHGGVDLYAPEGTPCFSIYKGWIEKIYDFGDEGWGKAILTRVDFPGWTCWALYAHLEFIKVKEGRGGEIKGPHVLLGRTGRTGNAKNQVPHLHFEIWKSKSACLKGTRGLYRLDPLYVLGNLPVQWDDLGAAKV